MSQGICHAFMAVIYLSVAAGMGGGKVKDLPGCWEYTVGEWRIALNGAAEPRKASWGVEVLPFMVVVTFGEWPAGIITAAGGIIAYGSAANERTFIAAVEKETKRLGGETAAEANAAEEARLKAEEGEQQPLFPNRAS